MAWDFSTEPEFEEKLEWMRGFVREEVFPLETLDLTLRPVARRSMRPAPGGGEAPRASGRRTSRPRWAGWGSAR